jgi:hypothetical protein
MDDSKSFDVDSFLPSSFETKTKRENLRKASMETHNSFTYLNFLVNKIKNLFSTFKAQYDEFSGKNDDKEAK